MLSVIIATHNGGDTLPVMLEALTKVRPPDDGLEIIAVDNASDDNTKAILESYVGRLPLTVRREPQRGKSNALHNGIAVARGELIVFTDDDVVPAENWLGAFSKAAEERQEASVFAGQVRHFWLSEPPAWLRRLADDGRALGGTPRTRTEGPLAPGWVKGANLAVRRQVLVDASFRRDLWIAGESAIGGEDVEFAEKAQKAGHQIWYVPQACVSHIIAAEEIGVRPFLRRQLRIGKSTAAIYDAESGALSATLLGYSRGGVARAAMSAKRLLVAIASLSRHDTMREVGELVREYGRASYLRRKRLRKSEV